MIEPCLCWDLQRVVDPSYPERVTNPFTLTGEAFWLFWFQAGTSRWSRALLERAAFFEQRRLARLGEADADERLRPETRLTRSVSVGDLLKEFIREVSAE